MVRRADRPARRPEDLQVLGLERPRARSLPVILSLRRRLQADDDGFTIMEVVVAMMVIAIGMLGLMAIQMRSIKTLGLAKQRQTASALTSRAVEQLRALP